MSARYQAHRLDIGDLIDDRPSTGSLLVEGLLAGVVLGAFFILIPFIGLVLGTALGIDVTVLP